MKGPGIKDYLEAIILKKDNAVRGGMDYLEVNSKELHAELSPRHATMPTCCQAMYKLMLMGDDIIKRPRGNTGFGSHLTIRYDLKAVEERDVMFPEKKRGRPAKSDEEKRLARKAKMKHNTEDLTALVKAWLNEHGWEYSEKKDYIEAHNIESRWLINIQGMKRGRKQTLPMKLSEVIKKIDDVETKYSIAFNDSLTYRRQWQEIPEIVKSKLNMSVILIDKKGNLNEIN